VTVDRAWGGSTRSFVRFRRDFTWIFPLGGCAGGRLGSGARLCPGVGLQKETERFHYMVRIFVTGCVTSSPICGGTVFFLVVRRWATLLVFCTWLMYSFLFCGLAFLELYWFGSFFIGSFAWCDEVLLFCVFFCFQGGARGPPGVLVLAGSQPVLVVSG